MNSANSLRFLRSGSEPLNENPAGGRVDFSLVRLSLLKLLKQKYHRLGGLNNKHLFLAVQDLGTPKLVRRWILCLVGPSSWFPCGCFLAVCSQDRESDLVASFSYEALILSRGPTLITLSNPDFLAKVPPPKVLSY